MAAAARVACMRPSIRKLRDAAEQMHAAERRRRGAVLAPQWYGTALAEEERFIDHVRRLIADARAETDDSRTRA